MERCPSHKSNLSFKIWPFQPLSSHFLQSHNKTLVLFDGKKGKNIKISQPTFTPSCRYCSAIYLESDSVILFSPQRSKSFTHHHLQFLIWSCRFPLCISEPSLWDISVVEMIQVIQVIQLIQDNQVRLAHLWVDFRVVSIATKFSSQNNEKSSKLL